MLKQTIMEILAISQHDLLRAFYVCCFWGVQARLGEFLQSYAIEKARIEARRQGHTVTEQQLEDGSVKLSVQVGGAGMSKVIEIIVTPAGETRVETKGFAGGECREASAFIERALGQRTSEQLTAEFHQQASQRQNTQQGN